MITITEKAKTYLSQQCENAGHPFVKLSIRGGGCAGFSYEYEFADQPDPLDFKVELDGGKGFLVDGMAFMYVVGTELDYVTDLAGSALKLRNPNESSTCGCGKSFAI